MANGQIRRRSHLATGSITVLMLLGVGSVGPVPAQSASAPARSCPDTQLAPSSESMARVQLSILCLLNARRDAHGLPAFARDRRLDVSASFQSADMADGHFFAHEAKGHPLLLQRVLWSHYFSGALTGLYAENIGNGPVPEGTAQALVDAWMDSSDHRANILDPRLRDIGIGTALASPDPAFYADRSSALFTTDFGRREEASPSAVRAACRRRRRARRSTSANTAPATHRTRWCSLRSLAPVRHHRRRTRRVPHPVTGHRSARRG